MKRFAIVRYATNGPGQQIRARNDVTQSNKQNSPTTTRILNTNTGTMQPQQQRNQIGPLEWRLKHLGTQTKQPQCPEFVQRSAHLPACVPSLDAQYRGVSAQQRGNVRAKRTSRERQQQFAVTLCRNSVETKKFKHFMQYVTSDVLHMDPETLDAGRNQTRL